jgi:hypothetical protein
LNERIHPSHAIVSRPRTGALAPLNERDRLKLVDVSEDWQPEIPPRALRFLGAAIRRLAGCRPYRLHCLYDDAELIVELNAVPAAMCEAYALLKGRAAEPLWIEGPWGETAMSYKDLDESLKLMYLSERWSQA